MYLLVVHWVELRERRERNGCFVSDYVMEVTHVRYLVPFELCLFVRR